LHNLSEAQIKELTRRARETLELGKTIGVIAWRKNYDTPFTKGLSPKKVRFYPYDDTPRVLGETIGLALTTPTLGHSDIENLRRSSVFYKIPIKYREIIGILESCADLLVAQRCTSVAHDLSEVVAIEQAATQKPLSVLDIDDDVLELLTRPRPRRAEMEKDFEKLTEAFLAAAKASPNKPGHVGKITLREICKECGMEGTSTQKLVRMGLVKPVVSPGKDKAGWYAPGEKMIAVGSVPATPDEPEDPYEWAKWKIAQKADLLAQKAKIEEALAEIDLAEKAIEQLKTLRFSRT